MADPRPTLTGANIVLQVRRFLGDPYVYGATGPDSFDCSGLVQYTLGTVMGVKDVPRTSESQWAWSGLESVDEKHLQAGDLVFSDWGHDASPGHVGIYSGLGTIIEAPRTGVPVHEIPFDAAYKAHVKGYKRLKSVPGGAIAPLGTAGKPNHSSATADDPLSGLAGIAAQLASVSTFAGKLALPSTWMRVGSGILGAVIAGLGVWMLFGAAGGAGHAEG